MSVIGLGGFQSNVWNLPRPISDVSEICLANFGHVSEIRLGQFQTCSKSTFQNYIREICLKYSCFFSLCGVLLPKSIYFLCFFIPIGVFYCFLTLSEFSYLKFNNFALPFSVKILLIYIFCQIQRFFTLLNYCIYFETKKIICTNPHPQSSKNGESNI